jgi:hypothetical protein
MQPERPAHRARTVKVVRIAFTIELPSPQYEHQGDGGSSRNCARSPTHPRRSFTAHDVTGGCRDGGHARGPTLAPSSLRSSDEGRSAISACQRRQHQRRHGFLHRIWSRATARASRAAEETRIFRSTVRRWLSTVRTLMLSAEAIALELFPTASSSMTSLELAIRTEEHEGDFVPEALARAHRPATARALLSSSGDACSAVSLILRRSIERVQHGVRTP